MTPRQQHRLLEDVRRAAKDHTASGNRLRSTVDAARCAGVPSVTVARAAMASRAALTVAEMALYGQCSYGPPPGGVWTGAAAAELIRALEDADAGVRRSDPGQVEAAITTAARIIRDPANRQTPTPVLETP